MIPLLLCQKKLIVFNSESFVKSLLNIPSHIRAAFTIETGYCELVLENLLPHAIDKKKIHFYLY